MQFQLRTRFLRWAGISVVALACCQGSAAARSEASTSRTTTKKHSKAHASTSKENRIASQERQDAHEHGEKADIRQVLRPDHLVAQVAVPEKNCANSRPAED